eukprot:1835926-Amphidinium_carterae.1
MVEVATHFAWPQSEQKSKAQLPVCVVQPQKAQQEMPQPGFGPLFRCSVSPRGGKAEHIASPDSSRRSPNAVHQPRSATGGCLWQLAESNMLLQEPCIGCE